MTDEIQRAADILRAGGLVAFPTETVYGLGADATNPEAVRRIFFAKGRPATNPLIVHVADEAVARQYARHWPDAAQALARAFWPGPITLVVPSAPTIAPEVTAGLRTVGLRSPDHPLALALLRAFSGPVAAPSANRSSRVSPTTAEHVRRELGPAVDIILDGGPCRVGIESTVLDLSGTRPTILRPGAISAEQLELVIGPIALMEAIAAPGAPARSPGQHAIHYAPSAPTYRFAPAEVHRVADWLRSHVGQPAVVLTIAGSAASERLATAAPSPDRRLILLPANAAEYARALYAALHDADQAGPAAIWIELPPDGPEWVAVRDRITRASTAVPR